jgi:PAS domain S-box-containing protein
VLERISDAFLALDADWRVTYANREVGRLNGVDPAALVGRDHWALWPETLGTTVEREYRRAMAERVPVHFEHHYADADRWHDVHAYPDAAGGLAIFYRDVTARRREEEERRRLLAEAEVARRRAEEADAAKARFLAVMSHELRTPLNAIAGYAQLLELEIAGPLTDAQRHDLERIRVAQQHLLALIEAVLDHTRLGAGQVRYAAGPVPLDALLAEVESLVATQYDARGVRLVVRRPAEGEADAVAWADPAKVRQIVVNLLTNALKYTPARGTVTVETARAAAAGGADVERRVVLRVRDTGAGIDAALVGRIFEPFVQGARPPGGVAEGLGLGLAISRELARAMGGELSAESTPGVGSTFTLALPVPSARR